MKMCMQLFFIFSKIGLFTLGGGYAMLPLMEAELTHKRTWISKKDFLDLTALAQAAPGILAVNMAIFVGYKLRGVPGAVCAALGAILPSFIIILLIAIFFHNFRDNAMVERIFKGIRPAVVALIAAPVFRLGRSAGITWKTVWFPVLCALLVWLVYVSPVYIVVAAGLGGWLFCRGARS
jgi:chromate transporter